MEPLSLSSGAAGLISLGITVCQGLLDYYYSWRDAESNVAQTYASLEALTKTIKLLKSAVQHESFSRDIVEKVEESIRSADSGLQSLQRKLDKIQLVTLQEGWKSKVKVQFRRTLYPFKESTLAKLKELGVELRDDLALALNLLQIDASATALQSLDLVSRRLTTVSGDIGILKEGSAHMSEIVDEMQKCTRETFRSVDNLVSAQSTDYQRRVYDWLSPLTVDFQRKHLDTLNTPGRQDGTAQSILETSEYKDWLVSSGETLWCPGIQGTGKTVLTSFIINHLEGIVNSKDTRLAYMYLSYKDAEKQNISNLLMSLVCQLAFSESTLSSELTASYEAHKFGATRPSYEECTQLLRCAVSSCAKIFLVIDAFDEYPEESRSQFFEELQNLQPKINVMITSRNLPTIGRQLSKAVRLDIQARSDDISQYLRERIASSERLRSYVRKDPTLCDLISTTITANAGGMFLQARLHLDSLKTKTTLRKLKNALISLPEGLNDTYEETMERIDSQHPDHAKLARKVLCWVFYAFRPLKMLEIQHALAVETGDTNLDEDNIPEEELLLSVCNGLVTFQKEGGFLALIHYTLQQYLEQNAGGLFPDAQVEIVRTCLGYLSFDEFEQGPCHWDQDFEFRLQRYPLLHYVVFNWSQHARESAEETCRDLILSFISNSAKASASIQVLFARKSMGLNYTRTGFPSDFSALSLATIYELESIVHHLLASGKEDVNRKTSWGDTALHRAAYCGSVGILELLLNQGADVSVKDCDGNTPLHVALIRSPSFYNTSNPTWTRMEKRSRNLNRKLTQSLLDHGADVNAFNSRGQTALHVSVGQRRMTLIKLLLARGANITLKDRDRCSPLTLASKYGYEEVARNLLKYDLQRQVQCGILDDAMRIAASRDQLSLLELLLAKSPEEPLPDPEGRNLLHICAYEGSLKCLQYLMNHGFDLGALDKQKRTCLHSAAANPRTGTGSRSVLQYLLEKGLDLSQSDVDGWTPLLWAAKAGNTTNIRILLDASAESPYRGDKEWTPFAVATYHDKTHAATLLRPSGKPLPEIFLTQQSEISLQHRNFSCDGCELTIVGSRYKCSECPDFDYCFKCVLSVKFTHPSHHFDFIYWDDRNPDVQRMERQEVMKELVARETFMKL